MEYNVYLLNEPKYVDDKTALINFLKNMSMEEREALIKEVETD